MIKPQVCLALSASLALMQANILGANAAMPTGNQEKKASSSKSPSSSAKGHSLFLLAPKKSGLDSQLLNAPAAVLTIHPSIENVGKPLLASQA